METDKLNCRFERGPRCSCIEGRGMFSLVLAKLSMNSAGLCARRMTELSPEQSILRAGFKGV